MSVDLNEFHGMFFEESFEALSDMETGLLDLDVGSDELDVDTINTIFRGAHSVKGGSGMFGFTEVTAFTHTLETLLDKFRDGEMALSQDAIDVMLQAVDCLREMLEATQNGTPLDMPRVTDVQSGLEALLAGRAASAPATAPAPAAAPAPEAPAPDSAGDVATNGELNAWRIAYRPHADTLACANDPLLIIRELRLLGELSVKADTSKVPAIIELEPEKSYLAWTFELRTEAARDEILTIFEWVEGQCDLTVEAIAPATEAAPARSDETSVPKPESAPKPAGGGRQDGARSGAGSGAGGGDGGSIRVGIDKVDSVINLVGELVITQSMLSRYAEEDEVHDLDGLRDGLTQLDRNTRELQQTVMQIRMLPISFSFNRFPRLVRDISAKLGKKINLEIEGEQTELDKTVLEKIGDPLVHLVRNSLDHGIEMPDERLARGKPEHGVLTLNAYHAGGNIVIEVGDDGQGLPKDKLLKKARDRGLVGDEELGDSEIHHLIFHPGFSTAENVSEISGRGVGMDVVKRNIQDLGGHVEVESEEGKGCLFRIRLPLTLAILDGQLVRVGQQIYVVSLVSIVESLQVEAANLNAVVGQVELYRLRDDYIPIVRLGELFGVGADTANLDEGLLVVVESNGQQIGLFVDDLLGQQQVVIKSLETNFRQIDGISGATILGDGTVALIIDVPGLVSNCATPRSGRLGQAARTAA